VQATGPALASLAAMRIVHLERKGTGNLLVPRCGDWGSMDTDWTAEPDEATCEPCRQAARLASGVRERPRTAAGGTVQATVPPPPAT